MPLAPNTRLGRYEIRSQIGEGGMGEVYLAQDIELDRTVAIKILPEALASDPQRLQRFIREAKAASALNHPHILTIYEIGTTAGSRFIATEFIDGETLRVRINAGMKLAEILEIAIQAGSALAAAHAAGIIHRDIKPENIMVRRDGYLKVLDFGLAKLTQPEGAINDLEAATKAMVNTDAGTVMGTVAYMSPEQARGMPVDARTDIFSFGVVLYEMVAHRLPFEGSTSSEVLASILGDKDPQPLARYSREVPAEIERIVSKALRKNRDERYQTIKDLLLDLQSLKQELEFERKLGRSVPPPAEAGVTTSQSAEPSDRDLPSRASTKVESVPVGSVGTASVSSLEYIVSEIKQHKRVSAILLSVLLLAAIGLGYWFFIHRSSNMTTIESLAVLPFVNASGNPDAEYLSDGISESLINSLSQLPHLSVKARSSVFRYKGKEVDPQQVASQLSVQAILNGRFTQRGDDVTLYLSLVDGRNGNQIWGEQYDRKLSQLISLQSEIARDVSQKLRARLAGADVQKVTRNYTENAEAYQLYLKGRFHVDKLTLPEVQQGISYFQKAIEIDPSYALAYVGLSRAYGSLGLGGEMPPTESFPKAKEAAQKAIGLDDSLSEAHTALGVDIFWYDWDWKAVENHFRRALELNPNSAEAHLFYAHLLSSTGRHAEALAEAKRARELDPLSPFVNAVEGQFLVHSGRNDEALARLKQTFELAPNFWFPHLFASSAYIEKGMYAEAITEARLATELSGRQTISVAFEGYALAKAGKRDEARAKLDELLKLSKERFIPPYHIALLYNALGEREETLAWLERGYKERDPKMTFLKVEPKWNNLRSDPHFQDLLRRVGFPQ